MSCGGMSAAFGLGNISKYEGKDHQQTTVKSGVFLDIPRTNQLAYSQITVYFKQLYYSQLLRTRYLLKLSLICEPAYWLYDLTSLRGFSICFGTHLLIRL